MIRSQLIRTPLTFLCLIFFLGGTPALSEEMQCSDLLIANTKTKSSATLTSKEVLLDLASRLNTLMRQLSRSEYINTSRLRYMKAMVLETTALNQYYGELYAHQFPDNNELADGFRERQAFLEDLNVHISSIAKYRDLEKWLIDAQTQAQKSEDSGKVAAHQALRDELNLIYYQLLAELHEQILGQRPFHFDSPIAWGSWFESYVSFLDQLPTLDAKTERDFLLSSLVRDFRTLHFQMGEVNTEGLQKLDLKEAEIMVHDLRRQIRRVNIILLKNSHLIALKDVEHDWLELDNSVVAKALESSSVESRYVRLSPTTVDRPVLFPKLSFYSIYFFTGELGNIKDQLERILFLEEIRGSLRTKAQLTSSTEQDQVMKLAVSLASTSNSLSRRSREFINVIKESHLFLYTSSWLREMNLEY